MHSLNERRTFLYFFLSIFMVHGLVMTFHFKEEIKKFQFSSAPLKVRLHLQENIRIDSKKQIVQSEDSAIHEKPTETAYQSDKDRKFDRQTVARNSGVFNKAAKGSSLKETLSVQEKERRLQELSKLAGALMAAEVARKPSTSEKMGVENGDLSSKGLSSTNDYVQDVSLGDFTQLNTVEYRFYGFFHRIRQKLEQHWGNSLREKSEALFRSGRRMPASQDLITSLQVTLNDKGEIIGVKILGASGVKELDDAAIESFNQAGPFPNPPKDLLVNGKAVIEWGFVVKS